MIAQMAEDVRIAVHAQINFDAGVELVRINREFDSLRRSIGQRLRRMREDRIAVYWEVVTELGVPVNVWTRSLLFAMPGAPQ